MAKQTRRAVNKRKAPPPPAASSRPSLLPDVTLGPEASLDSTAVTWMGPDTTTAPAIGEPASDLPSGAGGIQLLERFLGGRVSLHARAVLLVLTIAWFAFISWLFVQDNSAGRLNDAGGITWFWMKARVYTAFYVVVAIVVGILSLFRARRR
jgi:hypothetical protein